jgi:hypothetical protein
LSKKSSEDGTCQRLQQFRQAASSFRYRQQVIHLREKNIAGPNGEISNAQHCLARWKDLRFSMKMMLAAGKRSCFAACLNCYQRLERRTGGTCQRLDNNDAIPYNA